MKPGAGWRGPTAAHVGDPARLSPALSADVGLDGGPQEMTENYAGLPRKSQTTLDTEDLLDTGGRCPSPHPREAGERDRQGTN